MGPLAEADLSVGCARLVASPRPSRQGTASRCVLTVPTRATRPSGIRERLPRSRRVVLGRAGLQPRAEAADEVTGDRTIPAILVGLKGLLLSDEVAPGCEQRRCVPLAIRERRPGPPDRRRGQPSRG